PCFVLQSGDQFRAKPPPALTSQPYATDYNEVKALGAYSNSTRTPEQTELAYFYAGNNFILWNRILRDVAAVQAKNIGDSARLLVLANLAMADAAITAWDSKKHYLITDYPQPSHFGTNQEHTAVSAGLNDGAQQSPVSKGPQ
ncbi:MAG TPA: vanadium-dependent haloperoxidase, partial [Terriglobales bacterium]|nr:vanadium-dependent haloperoxidase [Terriglobales bacterium]